MKIYDKTMARLLDTSYRNFHAKGLDYVCLQRRPDLTLKIYFFDMDADDRGLIPEVVNPHDHRYDFATTVIRGSVTNCVWRQVMLSFSGGQDFDRYSFYTPLNGGCGFVGQETVALMMDDATEYGPGQTYRSLHKSIHTLAKVVPGTVLALEQYADKLPLEEPTSTYIRWSRPRKPPSLSGLYDRFSPDQMLARLKQLEVVSPGALVYLRN